MVKEQSFVASFALSISTDVTAGLGGSQNSTKNVLEALSFCESFSSKKDTIALKLHLLYFCTPFSKGRKQSCKWIVHLTGKMLAGKDKNN